MVENSSNINKTATSHLKILITTKTTAYVDVNPCPGLGQAHKCDAIK